MLFEAPWRPNRARVRCFCLPHAGGNGALFSEWTRLLEGRVEILAAHLPGRGKRFADPPHLTFPELMEDLERAAAALIDRDFGLFGHSLGGLIAHELAYRLETAHGYRPLHLFISGTRAPHSPRPASATLRDDAHTLSDQEFADRLCALGGIPQEYRDNQELMQFALPAVRADLRVLESYQPPACPQERRVSCPMTVFGGLGDLRDCPEESLREWSHYTSSRFNLRLVPGGHFFLDDNRRLLTQCLLRELADS